MLHHLAEQQRSMLDQLLATWAQTCQQLGNDLTQAVQQTQVRAAFGEDKGKGRPAIRIPKMTTDDDQEAFSNTLERSARAASWPEEQWAAILIPCLVGPAQQVVDTIPPKDVMDYGKMRDAILQMFNLSPKAYHRHLHEV